ncbi:hypothetical protein WB532_003737 [Vibrio vulnificus]
MTIPKIIHYVWVGGADKPKNVQECIETWKRVLTDYEIIEWNEDNFDIQSSKYVLEAYNNERWAFVADYIRLYVLIEFGGVYLDTDVIVNNKFDELLNYDLFLGKMYESAVGTAVIGACKNNVDLIGLLAFYDQGKFDMATPNNVHFTNYLCSSHKFNMSDDSPIIFGNSIILDRFSFENPCFFRSNGYAIHLFDGSWREKPNRGKFFDFLTGVFRKVHLFFYIERALRTRK